MYQLACVFDNSSNSRGSQTKADLGVLRDIHTEGVGFKWTPADGAGISSMWTSTQKIRAHGVILSSPHARKLGFFNHNFVL